MNASGRSPLLLAASLTLAALACGRTQGPASAPSPVEGGLQSLVSGGEERQYLVHLPPGLGAGPVPLVLNFHGLSSNAAEQEALSGMSALADQGGFIVVYPQALGDPSAWRIGPNEASDKDLVFVNDLLDELQRRYPIDPRRIYATGMSNGGGMVHRLGCNLADRFAAIAPVSGAYLLSEICSPARPLPVIAFHGTGDHVVPYDGVGQALPPIRTWAASWAARNVCDPDPQVFVQQGAATGEHWLGCAQNAEVVLFTIDGEGHSWPGSSLFARIDSSSSAVDATALMWEFFQAHPMP